MLIINCGIVLPFLIALLCWLRGVWKRSVSDLVAAGVMFCISVVIYIHLYSFTALSGVPWTLLLIAAFSSATLLLFGKNKAAYQKSIICAILIALCLSGVLFVAEQKWNSSVNSLLVVAPYRQAGTWVFDDARVGLQSEPFVAGIPELIDKLVADSNIPDANRGFRLIFSTQPFPGHQTKIVWRRQESAGNWYYSEQYDMEGWLCPALFKYFKRAPKTIYLKAEAK